MKKYILLILTIVLWFICWCWNDVKNEETHPLLELDWKSLDFDMEKVASFCWWMSVANMEDNKYKLGENYGDDGSFEETLEYCYNFLKVSAKERLILYDDLNSFNFCSGYWMYWILFYSWDENTYRNRISECMVNWEGSNYQALDQKYQGFFNSPYFS